MPEKFHLESSTPRDNLADLMNFEFKERIMGAPRQKIQVTYKSRNNQVGLGLDHGDIQFQKMEKQHIFTYEGKNVKAKPKCPSNIKATDWMF